MVRSPKVYYTLVLVVLITVLTGCELRRNDGDISDPGPVSDLPPTLAPLGAQTDQVAEATPIATIITVQPATETVLNSDQAVENSAQSAEANAQQADLSGEVAVTTGAVASAAITSENAAPETFAPPAEEATAEDIVVQEAIVVDANTSNDLPVGGPVAANPPTSQTTGSYDTSATAYTDGAYTVQPGDTLFSIATRFGTTVSDLAAANGLYSDMIYAGQPLTIPGSTGDYTAPAYPETYSDPTYQQPVPQQPVPYNTGQNQHVVAPGDTLFNIAMRYGTSVDVIAGANGIPYPYFIQAGQPLIIPAPGEYAGPPPPVPEGFYEQPYYEQQPYQDYPAQPTNDGYAPSPGIAGTHTVAPGETLFSIALGYGTSAEVLAAANGLANPNQIYVGQVLYLP